MTKSLEEKIAVMQAALEGKAIQTYFQQIEAWKDWCGHNSELNWNWDVVDYRVKPELIVGYLNVYPYAAEGYLYPTATRALECQYAAGRIVKMMEVVE